MEKSPGSFERNALRKITKNPLGIASFLLILMAALISVFAYGLSSDNVKDANQQNLVLAHKPMGYTQLLLEVPLANYNPKNSVKDFFLGKEVETEQIAIESFEITGDSVRYVPYLGDGLKGEITALPMTEWTDKAVSKKQLEEKFIYEKKFKFGTDNYGRDFYSRLIIGTRISFLIGFIAVFISLLVGIPIGAIGGYYRGRADDFIMWLINVVWSIPTLLLVIAITLALGKGFWQIFVAVGLTMWVEVARVVRGQFISYREKEFVEAAKAMGFGDARIIFKEILPNILAPVIVISAANFAAAILVESGLSFLGIGAQPPTPSWGNLIKENYSHIILGDAHLALLPGIAIMLLVLAFNVFGNVLRDSFDVK
ncbi:MAG: ABC transporter permease [Weeksellaceae bacterium]|jgi:peptide/nickel transport system permease protein|nr:ABC transporter permease [Weeksellaceae bacterium]